MQPSLVKHRSPGRSRRVNDPQPTKSETDRHPTDTSLCPLSPRSGEPSFNTDSVLFNYTPSGGEPDIKLYAAGHIPQKRHAAVSAPHRHCLEGELRMIRSLLRRRDGRSRTCSTCPVSHSPLYFIFALKHTVHRVFSSHDFSTQQILIRHTGHENYPGSSRVISPKNSS